MLGRGRGAWGGVSFGNGLRCWGNNALGVEVLERFWELVFRCWGGKGLGVERVKKVLGLGIWTLKIYEVRGYCCWRRDEVGGEAELAYGCWGVNKLNYG